MSQKTIHKLFSSPVFQFQVNDYETLNKTLSKYIYDLKKKDEKGIQKSNINGWHSQNFKVEKGYVPYNFIKSFHTNIKDVIVNEYGWKYIPERVGISEIWAIITERNF